MDNPSRNSLITSIPAAVSCCAIFCTSVPSRKTPASGDLESVAATEDHSARSMEIGDLVMAAHPSHPHRFPRHPHLLSVLLWKVPARRSQFQEPGPIQLE